jgi:zinc transport system ATP-binding protein
MGKDLIWEVKNLKAELEGQSIIENLSFEVKRGDVLTILGPNGAGKSVLLKTMLGVLPYQGEIEWAKGIKIGYVPQRLPFIKDIPLSIKGFFKLKESSEKAAMEILSSMGFGKDFLKRKIGDLSSGPYQRILIPWRVVGIFIGGFSKVCRIRACFDGDNLFQCLSNLAVQHLSSICLPRGIYFKRRNYHGRTIS